MFRRPLHSTRLVTGALLLGAVGAALAPGGPDALVPFKLALASADSAGNDVYVAVVVDFGSGSGMSSVIKCVPVLSSGTDSDALATAVGVDNVSYSASSGLLCTIDNYPPNGVQDCGASVGGGKYDYWSYWHGTSGIWQYSGNGPGEQSASSPADDVEGWVFQNAQSDNPNDPPPAPTEPPTYAQICNASTEMPPGGSPSPSTTPTTTSSPVGNGTTGNSAPVTKGGGPSVTTTTVTKAKSTPGAASATSTTSTTSKSPGTTTTTTRVGSRTSVRSRKRTALADKSTAAPGGSNPALPIVLIAAVITLLGGTAVFRWRRRPAEE